MSKRKAKCATSSTAKISRQISKEDQPCENNLSILKSPVCFIYTNENGDFVIDEKVNKELKDLEKPFVVVAIAGLYRTGKSYLMNRLAEKSSGFALGNTTDSHTKGIWLWARIHPKDSNKYLILLDTEGLGDSLKGDSKSDNLIFCLALLLSSMLVYNTFGCIDADKIAKWSFLSEVARIIQTEESKKRDDTDLDLFFPEFVVALRDCILQLPATCKSWNEYLDRQLTVLGDENSEANQMRLTIREYFRRRSCFIFDRPATSRDDMQNLEHLGDDKLSKDFTKDTKTFVSYVYEHAPVKCINHTISVTGPVFAELASSYVGMAKSNALSIKSAVTNVVAHLNDKVFRKAADIFQNETSKITLPTPDGILLNSEYRSAYETAMNYFIKNAASVDNKQLEDLEKQLLKFGDTLKTEDALASDEKCRSLLKELSKHLYDNITNQHYIKSGGATEFQKDYNDVFMKIKETSGLGIKKKDVLDSFLKDMQHHYENIKAADMKLIKNKEMADKREKELEEQIMRLQKSVQDFHEQENNREKSSLENAVQEQNRILREFQTHLEEREEDVKRQEQEIQKRVQDQREEEIRRRQSEGVKKSVWQRLGTAVDHGFTGALAGAVASPVLSVIGGLAGFIHGLLK